MKKILLCGLKYDCNFGDPIINDSCKYILEEIISENNINNVKIEEIDMAGRCDFNKKYKVNNFLLFFYKIIRKTLSLLKKIKIEKMYNYFDYITWYFTDECLIYKKKYKEKIVNSDIIIFVGGGIVKYKYQNFYHYINYVIKEAKKKNIPVALNAVGIEGFDNSNIKCKVLKKALNQKNVKMITTRDDLNKLYKYISKNNDIILGQVSDPAVYINEVYEISRNTESEIIGLGVCRGRLFLDNEIDYNETKLLNLWKNIIFKLDENNIKWKIYTNGLDADNQFALKLADELKIEKEKVIIPNTPKELVETISNFEAIINTRLHSSIIAYSLKVPSIGLVWNNKLKMFGDSIGYPERFLSIDEFNPEIIIRKLKVAISENYEKILPEEYRKSIKESLIKFIDKELKGDI